MPWTIQLIWVAVGLIFNKNDEILIAQRPVGTYKSGLWEFPGGKMELNEDIFQTLQRELREEVGIEVLTAEPWMQFEYDYGDRRILLDTWRVTSFHGEPYGAEGQEVQWV